MESGRRGGKGHSKAENGGRKDRRSATGMSGEPKKGGHGGKFTWAGDGRFTEEEYMEKGAVDAKDPNFEEEERGEEAEEENGGDKGQ
ncbi:programmed cell death protein 4-like [Ananas comosus]|uniref:Programmed cell death protein 4-like n=1 Tax=Ananas comosus TaxID=4615 RepID=A0A199W568_ANACO|nr:programmed cell death protein 4-like [Ananas comosus]OAY84391.1 hypothetical protein ACMD2_02013 [Ananas comosus]